MKIQLNWREDAAFAATSEGGHEVIFDGAPEVGGKNRGIRPMEGVLSGAAACSALDVVHILKKGRQALRGLQVQAAAERAESVPHVFTAIHLHFVADGDLAENAVARAVELGVEKYCSALAMLGKTAQVTHSFEIRTAQTSA